MKNTPEGYMQEALKCAQRAAEMDEVPVGCVIVKDGKILSRGWNTKEKKQLPTAHAEIMAIEKACRKLKTWHLEDCDLYVTLEPCSMCAGAIVHSRIRSVTFGASDPKGGALCSCQQMYSLPGINHRPLVFEGVLNEESAALLKSFFKKKRQLAKEKKKAVQQEAEKEKL
jgi:tRNA(adenine34) deaminase